MFGSLTRLGLDLWSTFCVQRTAADWLGFAVHPSSVELDRIAAGLADFDCQLQLPIRVFAASLNTLPLKKVKE